MGAEMSEMLPEKMDEREESRASEILGSMRDVLPPPVVEERIVARAMEHLERQSSPWRKLMHRGFGWGLTAATAAVAFGVGLHLWSPATTPQLPAKGSLHASQDLPSSFRVGPHEVLLSPASEVEVTAAEAGLIELRVGSGTATFDVSPLGAGEIFRVRTEHVLVEVVGTRFSVQSERICSSVVVEEGRVRVSDASGAVVHLEPNQKRRFCLRGYSDSLLREALVLISGGESIQKAIGLLEDYLETQPGPTLEEEALYHLSLAHARLGHSDEARRLADAFRERFPQSGRLERLERGLATLP